MKILEKLGGGRPAFSFEFFPPKDAEGVARLFETVTQLKRYEPSYVSVTYGAGGSTRALTVELVQRIKRETGLEAMAHLTCAGSTREELLKVLDQLQAGAIENLIALRGDPPRGERTFTAHPGGLAYASELVALVRSRYDFCIAAACYPEGHVEAPSPDTDLVHLKEKVDAGADLLISQLFFDNADFFRFLERAQAAKIEVPIVPGVMPITNFSQTKRFTALCGASIPKALLSRLDASEDDAEVVRQIGVEHATAQCRGLLDAGVPGIHFYTLNRSRATVEILDRLR